MPRAPTIDELLGAGGEFVTNVADAFGRNRVETDAEAAGSTTRALAASDPIVTLTGGLLTSSTALLGVVAFGGLYLLLRK